jgi:hypothetical protein
MVGPRAAELAGLQIGDVFVPDPSLNPNAPVKPGVLRVERTVAWIGGELTCITPKTKGSRRRVPLTAATTSYCGSTSPHTAPGRRDRAAVPVDRASRTRCGRTGRPRARRYRPS